jgi:hypothetical protein
MKVVINNVLRQALLTVLNAYYLYELSSHLKDNFAIYFTISQLVAVSTYLSYSLQPIQIKLLDKYRAKDLEGYFQRYLLSLSIVTLGSAIIIYLFEDINLIPFILGLFPLFSFVFSNKTFISFANKNIAKIAFWNIQENWYKFVIIIIIQMGGFKLNYIIFILILYSCHALLLIDWKYVFKNSVSLPFKYILSQLGGVSLHILTNNLFIRLTN